jgi:hypothetical protein
MCSGTHHPPPPLTPPHSDDEFEAGYVYGPEATNQDITARSLLPLVKKFVEGYNVCVMCFGPTGAWLVDNKLGSDGTQGWQ